MRDNVRPANRILRIDALNELDCRLVTDPANTAAWVPLPPDYFTPRSLLAATVWNLATRHGQLDLTFAPSGFPAGYEVLAPRAERLTIAGTRIAVLVASLLALAILLYDDATGQEL